MLGCGPTQTWPAWWQRGSCSSGFAVVAHLAPSPSTLSAKQWAVAAVVLSLGCFPTGGWVLFLGTLLLTSQQCKSNSLTLLEILETKHGNREVV